MGHLLGGSTVGLMVSSSSSSSPHAIWARSAATRALVSVEGHYWPVSPQEILKHSKAGLAMPLWGIWFLVHTRFCLSPPNVSGGCGFFCPPTVLLGLLLCLWMWGNFYGGIQHSPVNGSSSVNCTFGVLTEEDECKSFYSAIFVSGLF